LRLTKRRPTVQVRRCCRFSKELTVYKILIALDQEGPFFTPSEIRPTFQDTEPTLDHAIKAQRWFTRQFGFVTKREKVA
jgi:hypothetical protein